VTDPDVAREEAAARDYYTRTLRPYLVAGINAHDLATHLIAWTRQQGWRPALTPPADHPRPDPVQAAATAHRGAQLARDALTATREDHR
jgi:hypothetical protein